MSDGGGFTYRGKAYGQRGLKTEDNASPNSNGNASALGEPSSRAFAIQTNSPQSIIEGTQRPIAESPSFAAKTPSFETPNGAFRDSEVESPNFEEKQGNDGTFNHKDFRFDTMVEDKQGNHGEFDPDFMAVNDGRNSHSSHRNFANTNDVKIEETNLNESKPNNAEESLRGKKRKLENANERNGDEKVPFVSDSFSIS